LAKETNTPARVADYGEPQLDWGPTIDEAGIADQDLLIDGCDFIERSFGTVTIIYLHEPIDFEGKAVSTFHCSSKVIAEAMGRVNKWPALASFSKVRSKQNPRFSYWVVR
jgi:hypothetical protein